RGEPLPPPDATQREETGDFATLRASFRSMERELHASRARALEAARMRASVSLARGVAHELKNALTPLRLAARTLRHAAGLSDATRAPLDVIDAESQRLESLARAFSQFGRPPEGPRSPVDLVELVQYIARTHVPGAVNLEL